MTHHGGTMRDRIGFVRGIVVGSAEVTQASCRTKNHARVVVNSSLDREFSEPILKDYQKSSGVRVDAKYDVESTKTVGLTQLLDFVEVMGSRAGDLLEQRDPQHPPPEPEGVAGPLPAAERRELSARLQPQDLRPGTGFAASGRIPLAKHAARFRTWS